MTVLAFGRVSAALWLAELCERSLQTPPTRNSIFQDSVESRIGLQLKFFRGAGTRETDLILWSPVYGDIS